MSSPDCTSVVPAVAAGLGATRAGKVFSLLRRQAMRCCARQKMMERGEMRLPRVRASCFRVRTRRSERDSPATLPMRR